MAIINCAECGNTFSDKAPACPHCGCPIEFAKPQPTTNELTTTAGPVENDSTKYLLRDYLEKIRLLETDIYTMDQLILNLRNRVKNYLSAEKIKPPIMPQKPELPTLSLYTFFWDLDEMYQKDYKEYRSYLGPLRSAQKAKGMQEFYEKQNAETRKENEEREKLYQQQMKDYNERYLPQYEEEMLEYQRQMDAYDVRVKTIRAQVDLYNQGLDSQIALVVAERDRTLQTLQTLYNANIIFPKYRGIVPVTMFCEYMDSGRRTTLEGIHGMYDLYESELLGQRIVESIGEVNRTLKHVSYQLNGIACQLTGIARNQIMLHEEIAKGNAISAKISMDTDALLENAASMLAATGQIHNEINSLCQAAKATEANTAAAAYSAEVAARRVDAIAKIEEYEYSLRHPVFPGV